MTGPEGQPRAVLLAPHDRDLNTRHEWVVLKFVYRSKNGSTRWKTYLWLHAVCNGVNCSGEALLNPFSVGDLVDAWVGVPVSEGDTQPSGGCIDPEVGRDPGRGAVT